MLSFRHCFALASWYFLLTDWVVVHEYFSFRVSGLTAWKLQLLLVITSGESSSHFDLFWVGGKGGRRSGIWSQATGYHCELPFRWSKSFCCSVVQVRDEIRPRRQVVPVAVQSLRSPLRHSRLRPGEPHVKPRREVRRHVFAINEFTGRYFHSPPRSPPSLPSLPTSLPPSLLTSLPRRPIPHSSPPCFPRSLPPSLLLLTHLLPSLLHSPFPRFFPPSFPLSL